MYYIGKTLDAYERAAMGAWHDAGHALAQFSEPVALTGYGHSIVYGVGPLALAWLAVALIGAVVVCRSR